MQIWRERLLAERMEESVRRVLDPLRKGAEKSKRAGNDWKESCAITDAGHEQSPLLLHTGSEDENDAVDDSDFLDSNDSTVCHCG